MRVFQFVWRDGKKEIGRGNNEVNAWNALGYSAAAIQALSYYREIPGVIACTAECGCIHHAEDGNPCEHDIALWEAGLK